MRGAAGRGPLAASPASGTAPPCPALASPVPVPGRARPERRLPQWGAALGGDTPELLPRAQAGAAPVGTGSPPVRDGLPSGRFPTVVRAGEGLV